MHISHTVFVLSLFCSPVVVSAAQLPANGTPARDAPPASFTPSGLLRPSLETVRHTLSELNLEKWKRGTVREEAAANISTIMRDLDTTLPPLLSIADAAPESISQVLPVSRNIDAMYDVLVHVVEGARVSAPGDQVTQLQQAMYGLEKARIAVGNHLQETATAQEGQLVELRNKLLAQSALMHPVMPAQVTGPCVTPTPAKKAAKKHSPTKTPQTPSSPATSAPPTPK